MIGRCSLMVALPVLSLAGLMCASLPTALLSSHTGGFGVPHRRELTQDMAAALSHWRKLGIRFDAVLVGYVAQAAQLNLVQEALPHLLASGGRLYVDPVMGDHGRRYAFCGPDLVSGFRQLCGQAAVIFPNRTEAALLAGEDLIQGREPEPLQGERLLALGAQACVITGAEERGQTGVLALQPGKQPHVVLRKRYPTAYPGSGDLLAASLVGALELGAGLFASCELACDFLDSCFSHAAQLDQEARFGLPFERALPALSLAYHDLRLGGAR